MNLDWRDENGVLSAYSGDLCVGFVLRRKVDEAIVYSTTEAVHMRHIAKTHGTVSSFEGGKKAVERAWKRWLDRASLQSR